MSFVLLLAVACGGDDATPAARDDASTPASTEPAEAPSEETEEPADGPAGGTEEFLVVDTAFEPKEASVAAGTKVVWTQTGDQAHSVSAVDGTFDSAPDCSPIEIEACDGEGDEFSFTFDKPGTYDYYCRVHGTPEGRGMTATLTVE